MCRISNTVVAVLNVLFFVIGVALLGYGAYYHFHPSALTSCHKSLQTSLLILGAFVTVLSLLGLFGAYRSNCCLLLYLFLLLLLIIAVAFLAVFVFFITNETAGKVVSRRGVKEYKLGDYSNWLQKHVASGKNWDVVRSCLVDAHACKAFTNDVGPINSTKFFNHNFSPIQYGCCKPPEECVHEFEKNGTSEGQPPAGSDNTDCNTWSDNKSELCYKCNSCKAGFLANIRKQWRNLAIIFLVLLILMMFLFFVGCCARSNNRHITKFGYTRNGF